MLRKTHQLLDRRLIFVTYRGLDRLWVSYRSEEGAMCAAVTCHNCSLGTYLLVAWSNMAKYGEYKRKNRHDLNMNVILHLINSPEHIVA
jgi:hypothetical protein